MVMASQASHEAQRPNCRGRGRVRGWPDPGPALGALLPPGEEWGRDSALSHSLPSQRDLSNAFGNHVHPHSQPGHSREGRGPGSSKGSLSLRGLLHGWGKVTCTCDFRMVGGERIDQAQA